MALVHKLSSSDRDSSLSAESKKQQKKDAEKQKKAEKAAAKEAKKKKGKKNTSSPPFWGLVKVDASNFQLVNSFLNTCIAWLRAHNGSTH